MIDRKEALILTLNFTPQYYASSRDFAIIDDDTDDVAAVEQTFDNDWNDDQTTVSDSNNLVWSPGSEQTLLDLINNAKTSLDIYNEEVADSDITQALIDAAKRGVAVRIDMTYSSEWRAAFSRLTRAGAQVRTYASNALLYIHTKMIVADDAQAFVGSENSSSGSLNNNRELGIITGHTDVISPLEATFEKD